SGGLSRETKFPAEQKQASLPSAPHFLTHEGLDCFCAPGVVSSADILSARDCASPRSVFIV
ncbi:MAG: hypothetical protein SOX32_04455, partial [Candidatus Choladocola sp.]|nr:hypothetical protein [Candidatus Choladocola sp.]